MTLLTNELNLKCYVLYETKELLTEIYITIINILIFIVSIVIVIIIIIIITINVINIVSLPYLLNRHGIYVKLNNYFLQFLCHMTSDVKFCTCFFNLSFLCAKPSTFMN